MLRFPQVQSEAMTPAQRAIEAFGGVQNLAAAIGRDVSRIHRWTYPADRGGTDGHIPGSAVRRVLQAAKARGIELSANDLFAEAPKRQRKAA